MAEWEKDPGWQYLRLTREEMAKEQAKPYNSKTFCWVPDKEEGFLAGEIKETKGDIVTVTTIKGESNVKKDLIQEMNPPKFNKCEDMSSMSFLNDASVLWDLRDRYASMLIYTYSGLFCVVINPYKRLPIYTDSVAKMYMGKRKNEMPPHLFAASDEAFRNMMIDHVNQSMLITGESGAGKTENTKKVISYFAFLGQAQAVAAGIKIEVDPTKKQVSLEDQIVQTNPVLEAFGNAKTVRNNNSSRFGKFIRIHFSKIGRVAGCDIEHYLLEKSRVIRQAPGERAYHIFYQIMSGHDPELIKKLQLDKSPKEYWFTNQAETTIVGVDDKEEFQLTDEAFDVLNFNATEKHNVYRLCSAITHMGEMKFKQRPREEQADPDGQDEAEKASNMFGVNVDDFLKALCKPRVKVGTEWVNKGQNVEQVNWARGAMAKGNYDRMFNYLVGMCNKTLDAREFERVHFIGVLDIAGFEIFDFNSFEQLWINFVNEKLQQFFNHHMFVLEQEEYQREGIVWKFIDFGLDLAAGIELIEKPMGIISMLDEECVVPKGTDLTLAQKLNDQHLGKHPKFEKPKPPKGKQAEAHFALVQYAGTVRYNVTAWLEKNKDPLNDTVVSVLKQSKENELMKTIWSDYETMEEAAKAKGGGGGGKKKGKSASMMTVSMKYREGLNNLMSMLNKTHPHFVRCLIPNELKKSGLLDAELVMNQLTCNGVLEGIRICRKGFPNRSMHADFKQRYAILAADEAKMPGDDLKPHVDAMMKKICGDGILVEDNFRVGLTKVFFKAGMLAKLEDARDEALANAVKKVQSIIRWYTAQSDAKKRKEQLAGYIIVQRNVRSWCTLRTWEWYKLFGNVRPLIGNAEKEAEEAARKAKEAEEAAKAAAEAEAKKAREIQERIDSVRREKEEVFNQLQNAQSHSAELEEKLNRMNNNKKDMDRQITDLNEQIQSMEDKNSDLNRAKKAVETDCENLKRNVQDLEMTIRKAEGEKQGKDHQIRGFQDEIAHLEENLVKAAKEKKQQEEVNRKVTEDLQAEEDKVNHLNKIKSKLESNLDELEENCERERRAKADVEKQKRKVEGDLKILQEQIDELNRQKSDADNNLKKKEQDMAALSQRLDDEQSAVGRQVRQVKEHQGRIQELEEQLEAERQSRSKSDRAKAELQRELEELAERLDEAGGATAAQIELNKKREAEMSKMRRDLEEANLSHESMMGVMRKKHNDAVAEMGDQLDQLQKQKQKVEKDKQTVERKIEDLAIAVDTEAKGKANFERMCKGLEMQIADLQAKADEQARQLQEFTHTKARMANENAELTRQVEDAESQMSQLNRMKSQLNSQVEEAKRTAEEEMRERQSLSAQCKNYQYELDQMRDQVDEETERKNEVMRQLSKANAEINQWRARFEGEGLLRADEIEEARRKVQAKLNDTIDQLDQANQKNVALDKQKARLMGQLDDAQVEIERTSSICNQLEKKQKSFDKIVDEWRRKCDDLAAELDAAQRDSRNLSSECFKLQHSNNEMNEQMDGMRRENKNLAQELKDLNDALGEGGRSVHEMQKMVRRLEIEKDELQHALDEAEAALEVEESKVLRAQVEVSQIRQDIEKRIQEKEEEFENTRKNHQRALDSMQASLETEARGRAELMRIKKKLESDINELEIALDHANKANSDAQKNLRKSQEQIRELQVQLEDESRQKLEIRDQFLNAERRCFTLQTEKDELTSAVDQAERVRKQAEYDAHEARDQANELGIQNGTLMAARRKAEGELQVLAAELEETLVELKTADENAKKAMADAARLAEELRQEQEHSMHIERMRKGLEQQVKDMQGRLDEAEAAALKGGRKVIAKLETRIRELEGELDGEQRRHSEAQKHVAKQERRLRELQFQIDEDKKNQDRLQDLVDKLQQKLKVSKRQVEEAEELATSNLQKYRQLQHQLEDAEERADVAENSLAKMRAKNRSAASMGPMGLSQSRSAVFRSSSRVRAPLTSAEEI